MKGEISTIVGVGQGEISSIVGVVSRWNYYYLGHIEWTLLFIYMSSIRAISINENIMLIIFFNRLINHVLKLTSELFN